jgi:hypothetical protein
MEDISTIPVTIIFLNYIHFFLTISGNFITLGLGFSKKLTI